MVRVILTDDHKLFREGIKALLAESKEVKVVGEAANGLELLEQVSQVEADVVLLDIHMPGMDGFDTLQALRKQHPHIKVLALTMLDGHNYVQRMLEAGAAGYLLKNISKCELTSAIKLVVSGVQYISPALTLDLFNKSTPTKPPQATRHVQVLPKALSNREKEVLQLISDGYTNAEISEKLFTSKRTIETHRQNLLEKTSTKNTAALIKFAVLNGLIS